MCKCVCVGVRLNLLLHCTFLEVPFWFLCLPLSKCQTVSRTEGRPCLDCLAWFLQSLFLYQAHNRHTVNMELNKYERKSVANIHWKDWCWSWSSNTLAAWWKELTHWRRPWCWERLKVGGEGDDRGWDGWMASPTRWTWVWVGYGSWTGKPGVLQSMGSQRVGHDWTTELKAMDKGIFKNMCMWLCRVLVVAHAIFQLLRVSS